MGLSSGTWRTSMELSGTSKKIERVETVTMFWKNTFRDLFGDKKTTCSRWLQCFFGTPLRSSFITGSKASSILRSMRFAMLGMAMEMWEPMAYSLRKNNKSPLEYGFKVTMTAFVQRWPRFWHIPVSIISECHLGFIRIHTVLASRFLLYINLRHTFKSSTSTKALFNYPLVMTNIAIENGPVEIVDFPIKNGGSFHSYVTVYQRVWPNGAQAWQEQVWTPRFTGWSSTFPLFFLAMNWWHTPLLETHPYNGIFVLVL